VQSIHEIVCASVPNEDHPHWLFISQWGRGYKSKLHKLDNKQFVQSGELCQSGEQLLQSGDQL
jgi:hypothetical protein